MSHKYNTVLFISLIFAGISQAVLRQFPQKLLVSRDACQQLWSAGISNGQQTVAETQRDTIWTQLD